MLSLAFSDSIIWKCWTALFKTDFISYCLPGSHNISAYIYINNHTFGVIIVTLWCYHRYSSWQESSCMVFGLGSQYSLSLSLFRVILEPNYILKYNLISSVNTAKFVKNIFLVLFLVEINKIITFFIYNIGLRYFIKTNPINLDFPFLT